MPKPTGQSVTFWRDRFIENKSDLSPPNVEIQELQLRHKLLGYGLEDIRVEVLVMRFVYDYTFEEISDLLGIPSKQRAHEIYTKGLDLLKERGYRLDEQT